MERGDRRGRRGRGGLDWTRMVRRMSTTFAPFEAMMEAMEMAKDHPVEEQKALAMRRLRNEAVGHRRRRATLRQKGAIHVAVACLTCSACAKDAATLLGALAVDASIGHEAAGALGSAMRAAMERGDAEMATRCAQARAQALLQGDGNAKTCAQDAVRCLFEDQGQVVAACLRLLAASARVDANATRTCPAISAVADVLRRHRAPGRGCDEWKDVDVVQEALRAAAELARPPVAAEEVRPLGAFATTWADMAREGPQGTRLQASRALAHLSLVAHQGMVVEDVGKNQALAQAVWRTALPALLAMVDEKTWHNQEDADDTQGIEEAARAVGELVAADPSVAQRTAQGDAVPRLAALLKTASHETRGGRRVFASAMMAIAELCLVDETPRRQLVEAEGSLERIVHVLRTPNVEPELLKLACSCVRSLSRSVKQLRTHLMDANVADALLRIVLEPTQTSQKVLSDAVSSLCNLVLDFSPMKEAIVSAGGVARFAEIADLSATEVSDLSINALWALKNLSYLATHQVKRSVLDSLPWTDVRNALERECISINSPALKYQLLAIFRNLTFGGADDVSLVLEYAGQSDFVQVLTRLLSQARDPCMVLEQTLFVLCNIATGNEGHKQMLMEEGIGDILATYLSENGTNEQRVAAAWCTINLVWREPHQEKRRKRSGLHGRKSRSSYESMGDGMIGGPTNAAARAAALMSAGVDLRLHALAKAQSPDVRDRARTALDLLGAAEALA